MAPPKIPIFNVEMNTVGHYEWADGLWMWTHCPRCTIHYYDVGRATTTTSAHLVITQPMTPPPPPSVIPIEALESAVADNAALSTVADSTVTTNSPTVNYESDQRACLVSGCHQNHTL